METGRIAEYLHSLERDSTGLTAEIREKAEKERVPVIRRETESFLRTVLALKKPEAVLEIGTATAMSTLIISEYSGTVTTIENYAPRIAEARFNIRRSGKEDRIRLLEGDAGKLLPGLAEAGEQYDFIFLDAAKGQYSIWLEDLIRLMKPGAVLAADNVLQDGTVMESRFTVERRDRTTHARMREFLYRIKHDSRLQSAVLPLGDGVSVSVRIQDPGRVL